MPLFVRAIATVLIGVPGGLMWLGGMLSVLLSCWAFWNSPHPQRLEAIIFLGASVVLTAVGFSMTACVEMLNGAKRYRMARTRLPAYLGLELLEGLLAVAIVAIALAVMTSLADKNTGGWVLWTLCEAVAITLLVTVHRSLRLKGRTWRAESIDQSTSSYPGR